MIHTHTHTHTQSRRRHLALAFSRNRAGALPGACLPLFAPPLAPPLAPRLSIFGLRVVDAVGGYGVCVCVSKPCVSCLCRVPMRVRVYGVCVVRLHLA